MHASEGQGEQRTGYLEARRRLTANQDEDIGSDTELFDTVLQEQPLHRRDGYLGACLLYWRIMTKCRLPLTKYKPDADAVEFEIVNPRLFGNLQNA